MNLSFKSNRDKAREAVSVFAAAQLPELTKWRICKLLFLADKAHLVRYGRPITGDRYFALKEGPIPSQILNALNHDGQYALAADLDERLAKVAARYPEYVLKHNAEIDWDVLSQSEVEILQETAKKYGSLSYIALSKIVHEDPAYVKAWGARVGERAEMAFEDFFDEGDETLEEVLETAMVREALGNTSESLF